MLSGSGGTGITLWYTTDPTATGDKDGTVRLWNVATQQQIERLLEKTK